MKTESELKIQKVGDYKYIVLYYKRNNNLIRINTKFRYIEGMHTKELYYNSKYDNNGIDNLFIADLKFKVDMYIRHAIKHFQPVNQKVCIDFIRHDFKLKPKISVLDNYKYFYQFKTTELGNTPSLKDYKSLENALIDFQTHKNQIFKPKDITPQFILEFRNFLSIAHPKNYLTNGNLNDNTIHKRISSFRTFCRWLEDEELAIFKKKIYSIKTVGKYDPDSIALSKEELQLLMETKPANKKEERIFDLFILNCYLGLRWSDLMTINKGSFSVDDKGNYTYSKINEKTESDILIPVLEPALRIFEKYNWQLPKYAGQYFNRELKTILANHKLFEEYVKKKKRQLGDIQPKEYLKREMISSHTCRRTFITIAVSAGVPLNAIMAATGHKNLKTLQKYAKKTQDRQAFEKMV